MNDSISDDAGSDSNLNKRRRKDKGAQVVPGTLDRLPPHSPEAEQGALGCQLLAPMECVGEMIEELGAKIHEAYYDLRHQEIQKCLVEMYSAKLPIDIITVQQWFKDRQMLGQIGGIEYLSQLQDVTPSPANLSYYLEIVREKYLLRQWLKMCGEITGRIYEFEGDVDQLTDEVSRDLFKLTEGDRKPTEQTMRETIVKVHELYLEKFRRGVKHKVGPQTGFNYLDNILPGLGKGQLIVIAARPRTGKSAMVMQIAEHVAMNENTPVGIVSLEMSAVSLAAREVFQRAGADMTKFLNGFMSDADVEKLTAAALQLSECNLFIDESARMSIEDLEIRARRMVRRHNLGLLIVDYFQLLYVRNRHRQWSKSDELGECSMRLKALAKELNIPIILCSQMNREIEKESHRRPRLSDLRDTGQLEQDADVIMFLWKPDVSTDLAKKRMADILPRLPVQEDWRLETTWKKNLALVFCTVEKQREGRSGEDCTLIFIKPYTRFVDAYMPAKKQAEAECDAAC